MYSDDVAKIFLLCMDIHLQSGQPATRKCSGEDPKGNTGSKMCIYLSYVGIVATVIIIYMFVLCSVMLTAALSS
jgi:hypothetical protein